MRRLLITITGLLALVALAAVVHAGDAPAAAAEATGGITVGGTGTVSAAPDRATLSFGVESQGSTARAALAANGAEMRRLLAALRAAGATDLKTQSVTLNPRSSEGGEVRGFTATNAVSVTLRDIARTGAVIDTAVAAGANQVYGPLLTHADVAELYRQALREAVADARRSAQALAAAANLTLGRITTVVEGGGSMPLTALAERASGADGATPIEPGTRDVSATVAVTFEAA